MELRRRSRIRAESRAVYHRPTSSSATFFTVLDPVTVWVMVFPRENPNVADGLDDLVGSSAFQSDSVQEYSAVWSGPSYVVVRWSRASGVTIPVRFSSLSLCTASQHAAGAGLVDLEVVAPGCAPVGPDADAHLAAMRILRGYARWRWW